MSFTSVKKLSTSYSRVIPGCLRVINILITLFALSHCTIFSTESRFTRLPPPDQKRNIVHRVAPGETLYSIAWRYGLDYKKLAIVNNIGPEYRIFPGQNIILKDRVAGIQRPSVKQKSVTKPPQSSVDNVVKTKPTTPVTKTTAKAPVKAIVRSENKPVEASKKRTNIVQNGPLIWKWPATGKVITNFWSKDGVGGGIDIEGKKGESVLAAAAGKIVFAGSGLRGYGKLIIIKHTETYLSAYAYNNQLRVKEGEYVVLGQHIADIGASGSGANNQPRLHFQIRKNGKSIDPMKLLPKRKR